LLPVHPASIVININIADTKLNDLIFFMGFMMHRYRKNKQKSLDSYTGAYIMAFLFRGYSGFFLIK